MGKEIRTIKFYMDKKYHKKKCYKDIIQFLTECNIVENKLLNHYWEHFEDVLTAKNNQDFYNNRIPMPEPRLKFHHYMNILFQVYECLSSIKTTIINYKIHFRMENNINKQKIYNYCKGFCFKWDTLEKYIDKQLKVYKKKDLDYNNFLTSIKDYISNEELFIGLKKDIENKFYEEKLKISIPQKKEMQIRCSTFHTIDIDKTNPNKWIFTLDSNKLIGGTEKKGIFDKIKIPVKISDYHKEKLNECNLNTTFNIKLNSYNRIEIIACHELNELPEQAVKITTNDNEVSYVGIDIGLKKLLTTSDGEVIEQDPKIVNLLNKVVLKQSNRQALEEHLKIKYSNLEFKLLDKKYKKLQNRLVRFVTCDNRAKLKEFVKNCASTNTEIVMEDLHLHETKTNNKFVNNMMKRLHIQRIKFDVIKYSKENNVKVNLVNPAFTSQQCPKCNHISKKNRITQEQFKCVNCGYEVNADYNASNNIKNRHLNGQNYLDLRYFEVKENLENAKS